MTLKRHSLAATAIILTACGGIASASIRKGDGAYAKRMERSKRFVACASVSCGLSVACNVCVFR